ncbi:ADP-ribosylation factor-like protein 16 [Saccoglossus kowalevskii]
MGPIWHNYYKEVSSLMFMIDIGNPCQLAAACIQLLTVLSHEQLHNTTVLILLNKIDSPCAMKRVELDSLIRMDEIIKHAKQPITVMEISAREGEGLDEVIKWLGDNYKPST